MTYADDYWLGRTMRGYLLPVMKLVFGDKCQSCGEKKDNYDIDHLRYGPKVTMYDLQLLCAPCHQQKSIASGDDFLSGQGHCATCKCWENQ